MKTTLSCERSGRANHDAVDFPRSPVYVMVCRWKGVAYSPAVKLTEANIGTGRRNRPEVFSLRRRQNAGRVKFPTDSNKRLIGRLLPPIGGSGAGSLEPSLGAGSSSG